MPQYLVQFAQFHEEFRLAEFLSLARLARINYNYDENSYKASSPFFKVELESDIDAQKLVQRAILIKNIYELWGEGSDYEEVFSMVRETSERWPTYNELSFKFTVSAFGSTISVPRQREIINTFSFLGFEGPIDMKNPQAHFGVMEDYGALAGKSGAIVKDPEHIYMGRLVASGGRDTVQKYNLKKRKYLGTTSMDAELSLVMANQALAAPGKIIYDPFVGTGSFLFTCAHFGAFTMGSDIDGRQIRGKDKGGVKANIEQYNLQGRVLDSLVFDVCHHPWRAKAWLDAIVTDPPYGVRAGAKKLGRKEDSKKTLQLRTFDGAPMHTREDYYPPTKPYEMSEVLIDLLNFSVEHLRVGGRLVYWLPTVVDEYSNTDVPQHPCMHLVSNCEQNFGQWSRRLITMEKIREWNSNETASVVISETSAKTEEAASVEEEASVEEQEEKRPGHFLFREKYFNFGRQESSNEPI
ncbi:S-adenosyl-L-methionine-dependent methyltransferase [Spinellus fusiger]|nr:S-adenosyl-L-methionine-dependent methyltransferase [Spinellus fusiger]